MATPTNGVARRSRTWHIRRPHLSAVALLLALALAAWEGTLSRSAPGAHWSVLVLIGCMLVSAAVSGRHRQRKRSPQWAREGLEVLWGDVRQRSRRPAPIIIGVALWTMLILAVIGWDLSSFARQAHDLPTLSRLFGDVTEHAWGRALVFAGWLALGAYLAFGWHRPRRKACDARAVAAGAEDLSP